MTRYRVVVQIPAEIFVDAPNADMAEAFMSKVIQAYDIFDYPQSSTIEYRSGIAFVKIISIEPAIEGESEGKEVVTVDPESFNGGPQGPKSA